VLKDTLVPKLVYEMEQYERSLLELGKQQDVCRDFSSEFVFSETRTERSADVFRGGSRHERGQSFLVAVSVLARKKFWSRSRSRRKKV